MDINNTANRTTTEIEQEYDERDTVTYKNGYRMEYYDPATKKYLIFAGRKGSKLWRDIDYQELMDSKLQDEARLCRIVKSIDDDNMICRREKHSRKLKAVNSEQELMDMLDCKKRSWIDFKKKLDKYDIIAYSDITIAGETHKRFFVNPLYTMGSKRITLTLYKLFQESLDKALPYGARMNLQRHWEEEYGLTHDLEAAAAKEITAAYVYQEKSAQEHLDLFQKTVLHDKPAQLVIPDVTGWGQIVPDTSETENVFFLVQQSGSDRRKAEDIETYRNIAIDIDAGKDADGHYIKDVAEVEARKNVILDIIRPALPTPSAIMRSRDGFHIYYACSETTIKEEWLCTAQLVASKLSQIIDAPCTYKADQVLRFPNMIHHKIKQGLEPYETALIETNDIIYDYSDLTEAFDSKSDDIAAAVIAIISKVPTILQKSAKQIPSNNKEVSKAQQSERVQAIARLDTNYFGKSEQTLQQTPADARITIKRNFDIGWLLGVPVGCSFDCVLHAKDGGDGMSATVYAPDQNHDNYRYFCHCIDNEAHVDDIIGIVHRLSGRSYNDILQFLADIYGIKLLKNMAA